jgi:hypothetical protein
VIDQKNAPPVTHCRRASPRSEYLLRESQRAQASPTLAEKYQTLKSLTVDLAYYDSEGLIRSSQIKYTVNIERARSVFRVGCHNHECVQGDFDLSAVVAESVAAQRTTVSSELCCQGWSSRATINTVHCHNILRYKLTLGY